MSSEGVGSGPRPNYEVEVISTGNEIVFGQLVDTNSSWIAKLSTEQGARVRRLTCVGDDVDDIAKAISEGLSEGRDMIVITGGLGPSNDDLTIEAVAKAVGRKVAYDERALHLLEAKCRELSVELTERRKRMARSVEGSEPFENSVGFAPGIKVKIGDTLLIALPGIPKEMKPMFERSVLPIISRATCKKSAAMNLQIFMPSSSTFPLLNRVSTLFPDAYIKTHPKPPSRERDYGVADGLEVDVIVWGDNGSDCEARLNEIESKLVELVEGEGGKVIVKTRETPSQG